MLREALTLERLNAMALDEAAAWFVAQRGEGLAATEEALLADWLAADRAHGEAYRRAGSAWDVFGASDDDEILAAMRAHALVPAAAPRAGWWRVAAAAAVVVVVAAGLLLQFGRGPAPSTVEVVRYVAQREVREIALPDGSTMTLDAQSAVLARFGGDERSLELERGRALFDVEPDPARPFAVDAGTRRIVVLGTEFEVDRAPARLTVSLFRGKLAVEPVSGGSAITLAPGEQFVETGGAPVVRKLETGAAPAGWRTGLLDFDDLPLSEAVAEINRYASEPIVIRDPAVGMMRISGQFRAGDAERFAGTVAEIHPLRVVRHEGAIELAPAQ